MNECNESIHNIVRYAYGQFEMNFGNCENCHNTIALKSDYNQIGQSDLYKRKNTDKQMTLDKLLLTVAKQEIKERISPEEKQYIQILNSTRENDLQLFKLYIDKYKAVLDQRK